MTKILYLDYTAFLIYVLMIITLFMRTKKSSRKRGVFSLLLFVGIFATVYDICAVWLDNRGQGAVVLKYTLHIGYLILRNLITPIWGAYLITVTDTWHRLYKRKVMQVIIWIPFGLAAILTIISPITHGVFYLNEIDAYTRGPQFFILYASAIFYMCFCAYYALTHLSVIKLDRFVPIVSIFTNQVIAVIIQFFYPKVLCEMFATALCMLLVMLTIEKPEEKLDATTGLYKSDTFMDMIIQSNTVKKPCSVVLINLTNYSALSSYLSFSNMDEIYKIIARRLEAVSIHMQVSPDIYNLENGLFAAVFQNSEIPYAVRFASHAMEALRHDCNVRNYTISLLTNACVIKIPDDIKTVDEVRFICKDFRNSKYTEELIMASSIVKSSDYAIMANIDSILKHAIENDEFEVYYQPIYSVEEKRFNSAEALIRLVTKDYGFIRPDLFIPLSEESGLIHEIGMIVLEKVCQFISSDDFKPLNLDYIEINLSTVQCMDADLSDKIMGMVQKYNVSPSQINLEITETASAFSQKNLIQNLNTLHDRGFSFSLDDFGTGYSNLVRISSLPLHIVKLDKSFTWTEGNDDLKLILANTISMVKNMDMKIVVEGVETEEMLNTFIDYKCEYIQGYYFSKPLTKYDFIKYITDSL